MILHELPQADVHALFVAFGDDDQVDRQLPVHRLNGAERIQLRHLRPLRVGRAAADQHFLVRGLLDQPCFKRRRRPRIGLRDRHRVVHPVDEQCLGRALVTLGVHDRIARRAVLGDANVEHLRLLTAQLIEEALHHLGRLGNAFARVRDAGLANPLLQILHVLIDVLVNVGMHLLHFRRQLAEVRGDLRIPIRTNTQLLGRRRRAGGRRSWRLIARHRNEQRTEGDHDASHNGLLGYQFLASFFFLLSSSCS
jgi:hypothetical protein